MPKLHTALSKALVEKDVENAYKAEIASIYPDASITSPYASDGLIELEQARILFEAKYDLQLKVRKESMGVVTQVLFYLKKFEQDAQPLPQVILVGDKNECFLIATDKLVKYLKEDIDWGQAPSKPHPKLLYKLIEDVDIAPYIYDMGKSLDFEDVLEQAISLAQGHEYRVKATVDNIETLFQRWEEEIFKEKKLKSNDKVSIFLQALFYPENVYLHPKKNNVLVLDKTSEQIKVDANNYRSFFSMFHQGYLPIEIDAIYAKKDILIEETERRFTGQFYTPAWVNEVSQDMISEIAGENWRDEYLVIDPACGTGNLTRDYQFKDLVLSTLEQRDVDIIRAQRYNDGAVILQWDFLNDEMPDEIKKKLEEADKVIWYLNPPFGTAANSKKDSGHKAGISKTVMNDACKEAGLGKAAQQLYVGFLYRIVTLMEQYSLTGHICFYSKPTFMTGPSFKKFRKWWYGRVVFKDGHITPAQDYGASGDWGASFTCWERG